MSRPSCFVVGLDWLQLRLVIWHNRSEMGSRHQVRRNYYQLDSGWGVDLYSILPLEDKGAPDHSGTRHQWYPGQSRCDNSRLRVYTHLGCIRNRGIWGVSWAGDEHVHLPLVSIQ